MEDYLYIRTREGKDISRGVLKGLEMHKYPLLEPDHFCQMKGSKRESRERKLITIELCLVSTPIDLNLRHGQPYPSLRNRTVHQTPNLSLLQPQKRSAPSLILRHSIKTYTFHSQNVYVFIARRIRFSYETYTFYSGKV